MTTFTDGPAAGLTLRLRRAPLFLRVVCNPQCTWDALDQPDDRAHADESIFAYRKVEDHGTMHINSRDAKTGRHTGGMFVIATYAFIEPQPTEITLRLNSQWAEWAEARHTEVAR